MNHVAFSVTTADAVAEAALPAHYEQTTSLTPLTIKENIIQQPTQMVWHTLFSQQSIAGALIHFLFPPCLEHEKW